MTKLEEKLIQLGYKKILHNFMTKLTNYQKDFAFCKIRIFVRDGDLVMYELDQNCGYQEQYELDNLQLAYNQLQKDLEVLKDE